MRVRKVLHVADRDPLHLRGRVDEGVLPAEPFLQLGDFAEGFGYTVIGGQGDFVVLVGLHHILTLCW